MRDELAYKIIQHNCLIPGKLSRIILNKIINNEEITQENLPVNVSQHQITELKKLYQRKHAELKKYPIKPRYLPFYYLIKEKYPNFMWLPDNNLHAPRIRNLRPSLLSLLLGLVTEDNDSLLHRRYSVTTKLPSSVVKLFDKFMKQSNSYYPPENEMNEIVKLFSAGLNKKKLTVFVPICPDYAYKYTGNPQCPVEFTFTELGCKNGIIAQWILSAIKNLAEFFRDSNIETEFIIAMADFEAFAKENLKTFNLTKEEFLKRTFLSKEDFKKSCPISAKIIMFTELCDEQQWLRHIETVKQMFDKKNFGSSNIDRQLLLSIVANRKPLYRKWYGEKEMLEDYIQIALDQGMMYSAMGIVINEHFENCLVFAADNKVMRYFYSVVKKIPTLYLNKKYT